MNKDMAAVIPEYNMESMLQKVRCLIEESIDTRDKTLKEIALYFADSQGKMLRPTLTLACGLIGDYDKRLSLEELYFAAAGVEMLHMSALVHDDIIDEAKIRRGRPTVNAAYGTKMALLLGDYFYSRALDLLSELSDRSILKQAIRVIARMTEGEVKQREQAFDTGVTLKDYLRRISLKTASLTAFSCYAGARVAGLPEKMVGILVKFGEYFGKAYQIRDDILDFLEDERRLRKPAGDLDQGILTLPMILHLKERGHRAGGPLSKSDMKFLHDECLKSMQIERSSLICNNYLNKSLCLLEYFPNSKIHSKIIDILQKVYIYT